MPPRLRTSPLPLGLVLLGTALFPASPPAAADLKVACVGNSITYGYGLNNPYLESYPTQLDSLLGTGYAVSNFGVSGKTMIRASNDAYWTQPAFTQALGSAPDIAVIELGTNDSKDYIWPSFKQDFQPDYVAMIDTFRQLPSRPQVWVTLQPPAQNAGWSMYDTTIARQVNPAILQVALRKGAPVIDLRTAMTGHPAWFLSDTVHPNATGAKEMARIVARHLLHAPATFTQSAGILTASPGQGFQWYRNDTMLTGADSRTFQAQVPGLYKVSVQPDSLGLSRLVSAAQAVAATSGTVRAGSPTSSGPARVERGRIVLREDGSPGLQAIQVRTLRGERIRNANLGPGLYLWEVPGASVRGVALVPR